MVRVYYWRDKPNFGDRLAPLLLQRFAKVASEWSAPEDAQLVTIGSLLEKLPAGWPGIVAGAGKLHEDTNLRLRHAQVLALRGPLSAAGVRGEFVLADPGLLADELVGHVDKVYDLGIVPHWTDTTLATDPRFRRYAPHVIRVADDPLEVVREIGRCKKIVSSSLHGIVIADAFGIPRRTEMAPRFLSHAHQEGGTFKFRDYSASLGLEFKIGVTQEPDRNRITDKQHELWDVMQEIRQMFR